MLSTIHSAANEGVEAYLVDVEIALYWGLPGVHMVGLPGTDVSFSACHAAKNIDNTTFSGNF